MGSTSLAAARPTARPPGPWRQYPSSPEGWGVKSNIFSHCLHLDDKSANINWGNNGLVITDSEIKLRQLKQVVS